jgi:hypothetical protein
MTAVSNHDTLIYTRAQCGGLLDVQHDLDELGDTITRDTFDRRLGFRTSL